MERVTDIFDADTEEPSSGDLDVDLANAGQLLQKFAEEEGIKLSSLPDAVVEDLIGEFFSPGRASNEPEPNRKEASVMSNENQIPNEPTYADVAVELSKIAAEANIDLSTVDREEYHEAFANLAERMSDPGYFATKQAEESKLAEAYAQGQRMADGFLARLSETEDKTAGAADKIRGAASKVVGHLRRGGEHVRHHATGAAESTGKGVEKLPGGKRLVDAAAKRMSGASSGERYTKAHRAVGGAALGAGAAAAGGGAAAMHKKSLDEAAYDTALEYLAAEGYDVSKIASAPPDDGGVDFTEEQVSARATEMLKEAGYLPA